MTFRVTIWMITMTEMTALEMKRQEKIETEEVAREVSQEEMEALIPKTCWV